MVRLQTPAERLPALRSSPWFAQLPPDLMEWIAATAQPMTLEARQALFTPGSLSTGLYFVVSGSIRIASTAADGKEALLMFIGPGQWFGEASLFDDAPRTQQASAEAASTLLRVNLAALSTYLEAHPAHWKWLGRLLAQKLRLALHLIEDTALNTPSVRLARRLVAMAYAYGPWQGTHQRVIEIQQSDLGSMLGISRQSVNQILKEFEAMGAVSIGRGSVTLLDIEVLKRFVRDVP